MWTKNSKNKYGNRVVTWDGQKYDSQKEFNRYNELVLMQRAGVIEDLERQKEFVLIPAQKDDSGHTIERKCSYKADFVYKDKQSGETVVEDTKGFKTKEYIIKRKLMLHLYGIRITEI